MCAPFEHFRDIETSNHVTGRLCCLCIFHRSGKYASQLCAALVRKKDRFYGQMQNNRDFTLNHERRSLGLGPKVHETSWPEYNK